LRLNTWSQYTQNPLIHHTGPGPCKTIAVRAADGKWQRLLWRRRRMPEATRASQHNFTPARRCESKAPRRNSPVEAAVEEHRCPCVKLPQRQRVVVQHCLEQHRTLHVTCHVIRGPPRRKQRSIDACRVARECTNHKQQSNDPGRVIKVHTRRKKHSAMQLQSAPSTSSVQLRYALIRDCNRHKQRSTDRPAHQLCGWSSKSSPKLFTAANHQTIHGLLSQASNC
jgi:hypothetical protein